jgi:hypothetical protein
LSTSEIGNPVVSRIWRKAASVSSSSLTLRIAIPSRVLPIVLQDGQPVKKGDANIQSIRDLIDKSNFYRDIRPDAGFVDRKAALEEMNGSLTLDMANVLQDRLAYQQVVLQCIVQENLDALLSPAGNIPAYILGALAGYAGGYL